MISFHMVMSLQKTVIYINNMYDNLTKADILKMSREDLIKVLEWNDPNGIYNDDASLSEGLPIITKQECIEIIINQFEL